MKNNVNLDKIKEEIFKTKNLLSNDLSKEEEEEVNIFIEGLIKDLQEKIKNIDIVNLTKNIDNYFKEKKDV